MKKNPSTFILRTILSLFVFVSDLMLIGIIFNMTVRADVRTVSPLHVTCLRFQERSRWDLDRVLTLRSSVPSLFSIPRHASCSIRPLSVMNSVIAFAPTFMQLATIFFIRCAIARLNTKTGYRGGE